MTVSGMMILSWKGRNCNISFIGVFDLTNVQCIHIWHNIIQNQIQLQQYAHVKEYIHYFNYITLEVPCWLFHRCCDLYICLQILLQLLTYVGLDMKVTCTICRFNNLNALLNTQHWIIHFFIEVATLYTHISVIIWMT